MTIRGGTGSHRQSAKKAQGRKGANGTRELEEGLVIALEPIISATPSAVVEDVDGWTIRTATGCLAAHYEHTIVIRGDRAEILTAA